MNHPQIDYAQCCNDRLNPPPKADIASRMSAQLLIAVVLGTQSLTAAMVEAGATPRQFASSASGIDQFAKWVLAMGKPDIKICVWSAEDNADSGPLVDKLRSAAANGKQVVLDVGVMGHQSALRMSKDFGYSAVSLEAASRYCKGEWPRKKSG